MGRMKAILFGTVVILLAASAGCGSLVKTRSFLNPQADFSFYKKVAILPFRNQADDKLAGDKVTEQFMTELLIAGELDVMDPGQFNAVVAQVARTNAPVSTLELGSQQLGQIATVAAVQGIFTGTLHEYKMVQIGGDQYPMISMTVKFIDAPTGTVAWQNSINATGGPNLPIISVGETFTMGELSQKLCRIAVKDFFKKAYSK